VENVCRFAFLAGVGVSLVLYKTILPRNDPRGLAVGFTLGCFLGFGILLAVITVSRTHTWREYWDYQELKYGARNAFALYLILPVLGLSIYGVIHLLVNGI